MEKGVIFALAGEPGRQDWKKQWAAHKKQQITKDYIGLPVPFLWLFHLTEGHLMHEYPLFVRDNIVGMISSEVLESGHITSLTFSTAANLQFVK